MPSMANITVKKADGTTDIVYTGVVPSSGDGNPAIWQAKTVSTYPAGRPEFRLLSKWNGTKTLRQFSGSYTYPLLADLPDGTVQVKRTNFIFSGTTDPLITDAFTKEGIYQFCNLMAAALVKQMLEEGYAAT